MHFHNQAILIFLSLFLFASASELDYDGYLHIRLWHSLNVKGEPHYEERGNISISSIRTAAGLISQPQLSRIKVAEIEALSKANNKYRLKATVKTSSGSETTFLTSVLACNLVGSNLEDILYVWLDSTGEPVAINLVSKGPCTPYGELSTDMWTTDIQIKYPDGGPAPDTATYIQKIEREKQARESGEVKDNRSFFAKYWMYIVPALIFFVLSSATNPEAGGSGGGGGGGALRQ